MTDSIYCFFDADLCEKLLPCLTKILIADMQILTASLMLNCLDRYCLLSCTISRSMVMSWLPAMTTFSLWGSVPSTKEKMQSPTIISLYCGGMFSPVCGFVVRKHHSPRLHWETNKVTMQEIKVCQLHYQGTTMQSSLPYTLGFQLIARWKYQH